MSPWVYFGIGVAAIIIVFIVVAILMKTTIKRNKHTVNQEKDNLYIHFEQQKKIWFTSNRQTVKALNTECYINFNKFPFNSDYISVKEHLIKNNVSFKIVKEVNNILKNYDDLLLANWIKCQHELFEAFDKSNLELNYINIEILTKYYLFFLNEYKKQIITNMVNVIVPKQIKHAFQNEVINLESLINNLNLKISDFIREMIKDFQSKSQDKNQTEQNKRKEEKFTFTKKFDDLTMAYNMLKVNPNCTDDELKKNYRKLAMKYHPDRNNHSTAKDMMVKINQAYELIKLTRKM